MFMETFWDNVSAKQNKTKQNKTKPMEILSWINIEMSPEQDH